MTTEKLVLKEPLQPAVYRAWTCVTCGASATGAYCSHCGEKHVQGRDISFAHLGAEALEAFFHLDSKLFLTLRTLFRHPGQLTADFFLGRRKLFMAPLQTFLVCNLIFFVLQPLTGLEILAPPLRSHLDNSYYGSLAARLTDQRLARKHISRDQKTDFAAYEKRFDQVAHIQARTLVILMVPMFATVLALFLLGTRRYFIEHLLFSLHFYSWWLLWILAVLTVGCLMMLAFYFAGHMMRARTLDNIAVTLELGGFAVYLFFALRAFYKLKLARALVSAALLGLIGYYIMHVYRFVLFFTTLYAT